MDHPKYVLNQYPNTLSSNDDDIKTIIQSLTNEQLKEIIIDYRYLFKPVSFDNPISWLISESCTSKSTYNLRDLSVEQVVSFVTDYFDLVPCQIRYNQSSDGINQIEICIPVIGLNLELIEKTMESLGYTLITSPEEIAQGNLRWLYFVSDKSCFNLLIEMKGKFFFLKYFVCNLFSSIKAPIIALWAFDSSNSSSLGGVRLAISACQLFGSIGTRIIGLVSKLADKVK